MKTVISPHLLHLNASYSYRTYTGILGGTPSQTKLIAEAKHKAQELWGERATFIIQPKSGKSLPSWVHMAWANGPAIGENSQADGSEMVIIWWSEMQPDTDRVLSAVDWEKHAGNFQY